MNERTNTILKQLTFIHSGILWNLWIMVWKLLFLKEMWLTVTTWQCHGVWLYLDSAEGISVKKLHRFGLMMPSYQRQHVLCKRKCIYRYI